MANVNNYIAAGQAAVRKNLKARQALAENKTDFGALGEESIKAARDMKIAAIRANAKVANAAQDAMTKVTGSEITSDMNKSIAQSESTARKAGVLASGAVVLGYAAMQGNKEEEGNAEMRDLIQAQTDYYRKKSENLKTSGNRTLERPELPTFETPDEPKSTATNTSTGGGGSNSNSSSSSSNTSGTVAPAEVYSYLTKDKGLSKNKALGLMANIERESSFRINPQGGDNGNSFGMFQWNNTYGRSDLMKKNVPDWQTNWKGQIDHALSQNQLPEYNRASANFQNTTWDSPLAAADYYMNMWERPADPHSGSKKHAEFISRYNF